MPSPGPPLSESLLTTGKGNTFIINCLSFDQHRVDPAAFQAVFDRKAFSSVTNYSVPTHVSSSFTLVVVGICKLDSFYFPFDEQSCALSFSSFTFEGGPQVQTQLLLVPPSGRVLVVSMPSAFICHWVVEIVTHSKHVFLLMMIDLLSAASTSFISVYFALCLSLMVVSLLDTVFITHLLHVATTQPPPLPRWLHSLLLSCTSPGRCCPTAPQKRNEGLGLTPNHLPGAKEPEVSAEQRQGPGEAELTGGSKWTRAQWEHGAQRQHSELWVQFSHAMDALLFRLYLLFMASSILTVIGLWNT
ncbi:hypothetical protein P7K49_030076 [Saguinus oedipus]|uniref:Neurotransmitter-gated ion-channel ligand-binding domain-containing protein n=1 Tax=Saguinus oedipus TaxID=9490 RepID=A0ABQ9U173_SAGOE|nr:hypothetical protein P7K49_030076 [Saguinus oedipus]